MGGKAPKKGPEDKNRIIIKHFCAKMGEDRTPKNEGQGRGQFNSEKCFRDSSQGEDGGKFIELDH